MPVVVGDYSLSVRRWNENPGSMFPDMFVDCKKSTDGGTTWTQVQQDSKPAMWNIMLNAVEAEAGKPVPQLMYGRYNGKNIYIPGEGSLDIPEGGIYLDLSDHDSPDSVEGYNVWIRNNAGTLELSATTDAVARTDGIDHKSGDSGYRYLGGVYPEAIHTGHYGPVDVIDKRGVLNRFNKIRKLLGKLNPYGTNTNETITALYDSHWQSWNDDDFLSEVLAPCAIHVHVSAEIGIYSVAAASIGFNFGVNGKVPVDGGGALKKSEWNYASTTFGAVLKLCGGLNKIRPLANVDNGEVTILYRYGDNRGVFAKYSCEVEL